jgi:hypothetical protein
VAGLNPWPLYTSAKSGRYLLNWRLGRPESQSGRFGKEEEIILFLLFLLVLFLYLTFRDESFAGIQFILNLQV